MAPNILTIPAGAPFAETLARGLVARFDPSSDPLSLASTTIYLPTRRAVRTLTEAFATELGGAALLPQMRPLGDVDEDDILFDQDAGDLALKPSIPALRRRFLMARMVMQWEKSRRGEVLTFAQAASLARGLAHFQDEADTQRLDLKKLDALVPDSLADHWRDVHRFLSLLRDVWPEILHDEGASNPMVRRNDALSALTRSYCSHGSKEPVIAAGSTGSIPATAELLAAIAHLENGQVILPGLDLDMDEASWDGLDEGHPQYGMKQLLQSLGVARADVTRWGAPEGRRSVLLREALRPAPTTDAWQALAHGDTIDIAQGLETFSLIETAQPQEEALVIALILREALEDADRTAALVTPDRNLARRVASELARWDIAIDDSAGRPLANTPPGTFLTLLAEAAHEDFSPVALLALLKHPLSAGSEEPDSFRRKARALDRHVLRGPTPDAGLAGLLRIIESKDDIEHPIFGELKPWLKNLAVILQPLAELLRDPDVPLGDIIAQHVKSAESLAAISDCDGAAQLWRGDAGQAAASLMTSMASAANQTRIDGPSYAALFRTLALEQQVRVPHVGHPRLAILGPLEARLQSFDTIVLGSLNENAWPQPASNDPWLSRPMRKDLGLEAPERAIGLAAHDFAMLASAPRVFLTRSLKVDGSPTVASRWLQRLKQLTEGLGLTSNLAADRNYIALAHALEEPPEKPERMKRPAPSPLASARPKSLSVTEIETWIRDPYAIYAKHVLRLRPLDPLEAELGARERGTSIHTVLEEFLRRYPDSLPADAEATLIEIARDLFNRAGISKATLAVWMPRFLKAAHWFVAMERGRRFSISRSFVELQGEWTFRVSGKDFRLRGRADRIDVLKTGGAAIVDYKTGLPPSSSQVNQLFAPQLPLEGAILKHGGFANVGPLKPEELLYIQFTGGAVPGEQKPVKGNISDLVAKSETFLVALIARYDNDAEPYLPRVLPYRADVPGDYDHLSRVREWSLTGWESEEDGE